MSANKPRILLCAPSFFDVTYAINPWMHPEKWSHAHGELQLDAQRQWGEFISRLMALGVQIELAPPREDVPDMVFTANSAVVLDGQVLLARFRHRERQPEEAYFRQLFDELKTRGIVKEVHELPDGVFQEGAGDAIWDQRRNLFWVGYGPRSCQQSIDYIQDVFGRPIIALELVDERFYHLDTCFMPLSGGHILFYPDALHQRDANRLRSLVGDANMLIEATAEDAAMLSVNGINIGDTMVMGACSHSLERRLNEAGYRVIRVPLSAFAQSGGSAYCLSLRLDLASRGATGATMGTSEAELMPA